MKCNKVQEYCIEMAGNPLPEAIEQHIRQCAECKAVYQQTHLLFQLISLKRYEQPDVGVEARCLATVQAKIDVWKEEQPQGFWKIWHVFDAYPAAAVRYILAALVIGFIGVNLLMMQDVSPLPSVALDDSHSLSSLTDADVRDMMLQVTSNRQPGQVQYGSGPSRTVDYEY